MEPKQSAKLLYRKRNHKQNEETMYQEKIFASDEIDKGLIPKIYKQLIQLDNEKQTTLTEKWSKDLNSHFSEKDMQMTIRYIKDVQH